MSSKWHGVAKNLSRALRTWARGALKAWFGTDSMRRQAISSLRSIRRSSVRCSAGARERDGCHTQRSRESSLLAVGKRMSLEDEFHGGSVGKKRREKECVTESQVAPGAASSVELESYHMHEFYRPDNRAELSRVVRLYR